MHMLKRILANLSSNAIKFTSEGYVSVKASVRKPRLHKSTSNSSRNQSHLRRCLSCFLFKNDHGVYEEAIDAVGLNDDMEFVFEVNDTGKGIPKEKQTSVFENYVHVKETDNEVEGTVLGLGIVQSLVRFMGGEISIVDKEIGENGTCFRFNVFLKVCRSAYLSSISEDEKTPEFGGKFPTPPDQHQAGPKEHSPIRQSEIQEITQISPNNKSPLQEKKVLLAEDDVVQQTIAKKILSKHGVTIKICTNGKESLTMVSKGLSDKKNLGASHILPYEYILMDCEMPVMDGCEATRQIRLTEKDYGVHAPIIDLTTHVEDEEQKKMFVAGIDIYVSKPLNEQKVLNIIKDLQNMK